MKFVLRPRFGLRSLFVAVTCAGLLLALALAIQQRGLRQQLACEEISRLGGGYAFEPHIVPTWLTFCYKSVAQVSLHLPAVHDEDLAVLDSLGRIKRLSLAGTSITDRALPRLKRLQRLEWIDLRDTAFSDAAVLELRESIPRCQIIVEVSAKCRACRRYYTARTIDPTRNLCPACNRPAPTP